MIKPDFMLDPSELEIYTLSGKNVVVATVKQVFEPVSGHCIYWIRRGTHAVSLKLVGIARGGE